MKWDRWRLVANGFATLQEIETHYSWLDLQRANEALDIHLEVKAKANQANEGR